MKVILSDKVLRIIKARKKLEKEIGIKIENRGKEVKILGTPEKEYIAEKVIDAINFGFPLEIALSISKEDYMFEVINIKDHTRRNDLERVRGRIIGKAGKALKTLSDLTGCFFEIKDNFVAIIGNPELMERAQEALISIIKGSKHSNVYAGLEKRTPKPIQDLGLKDV
jgi:ribosomal RNA assembly protein